MHYRVAPHDFSRSISSISAFLAWKNPPYQTVMFLLLRIRCAHGGAAQATARGWTGSYRNLKGNQAWRQGLDELLYHLLGGFVIKFNA